MTDLLFDPPWYLPPGIAALGVYLFIHGNRRQDAKIRAVGGVVVLLAVAVFFVGRVMDTDREIVEKRSRQLVDAVEKRDWNTLRSLLDPKASVATPSGAVYSNRDLILAGAQLGTEQYGIKNIRILSLESRQDGTMITVDMDLISDQGLTGQPFPTSWQFEWQELSAGWTLTRIVCLKIGNETGPNLSRQFPQAR
jgi:hypothetical protein